MVGPAHKLMLICAAVLATAAAGQAPAAPQGAVARKIPGITVKDAYPNGCVDCHVNGKAGDTRLSTLMTAWTTAVPAALVEKARASSAAPSKIKGKHPAVPKVASNIPQMCLNACHKKGSTIAPPFAQLLHTIHLTGGSANRFLTDGQGECTHCHKLDAKTGAWKMPSGAEK